MKQSIKALKIVYIDAMLVRIYSKGVENIIDDISFMYRMTMNVIIIAIWLGEMMLMPILKPNRIVISSQLQGGLNPEPS